MSFPYFALGAMITAMAAAQTPAAKPATTPPAPAAKPAAEQIARPDGLYANIQTSLGGIVVQLFEKETPLTVKNFMDLALGRKPWTHPKTGVRSSRPLYPGTTFHRVIPGFMIQGGDPAGTGMGGTDVIKDEFLPTLTFDKPGRLAMANAGPGTGSCQFFITEVPTPHLNGRHTIFGQVVENQELVTKIANVPRNPSNNRPNTPVTIQKISFDRWQGGQLVKPQPPAKKAPAPPTGSATKKSGAQPSAPAKK